MTKAADLQTFVDKQKVGQTLQLDILRNNIPLNISVTLQEKP
jgi:S1-C subfamily serine protease